MEFKLKNNLKLSDMRPGTRREIKSMLTLKNKQREKLQRMNKWVGNVPAYIKFYEETADALTCPRGAAEAIYRLCLDRGEQVEVIDNRLEPETVDFDFTGKLRPFQEKGIQAMLTRSDGNMVFPTGGGKLWLCFH